MTNCWLHKLAQTTAYDRAMRLPILAFNGYFLVKEIGNLQDYLGEHPAWGNAFFDVLLNTASRLALLSFFAILFIFHLIRMRPVAKAHGIMPRVVALLSVVLVLGWVFLPRAAANPYFDTAALAIILFGNQLSLISVSYLGRSLSVMPEARKLVTGGPYGLVRHPLYVAEATSLLGIFLLFRNWEGFALLTAIVGFQLARLRYEERVLTLAFPEYVAYRASVPALFPTRRALAASHGSGARLLAMNLLALASVATLAWIVATKIFDTRHFPVIEISQPGVLLTVLKQPSGSEEACQKQLSNYEKNLTQRCSACQPSLAACKKALDTEDEAALRGEAIGRVYLKHVDASIVIRSASPGSDLKICQSMLQGLGAPLKQPLPSCVSQRAGSR